MSVQTSDYNYRFFKFQNDTFLLQDFRDFFDYEFDFMEGKILVRFQLVDYIW